ncbi:MAG: hypothetical protein HYT34_01280 [Candidatus Ryanbacteria bacterium]|nr:hypothetical protein [Candidatus Ryanbacteria bacterium]
MIKTRVRPVLHQSKIERGGILLEFDLEKGSYATTFLTHLFRLMSGLPPENIEKETLDPKTVLGRPSLTKTFAKFEKIIHPKTENIFETLGRND